MPPNFTTTTSPPILSPRYTSAEAWFQALFCYIFLCGLICTVANSLIIAAVCRRPSSSSASSTSAPRHLRTRFFVIICYLSLCRLLLSVNLASVGAQRIGKHLGYTSYDQTRFTCKLSHFWYLNGLSLELLLILVLLIDRIVAVSAGMRYRNLTLSQASHVCLGCYAASLVGKTVPAFLLEPRPFEVAPCVNVFDSLSDWNAALFRYLDLSLLALIVFIYACLLVYIRCRIRRGGRVPGRRQSKLSSRASNTTLRRQAGLLPILRNQIILHTGLSLICKLLLLAGGVVGREDQQRLLLWGGVALAMDLFVNTMALALGNGDLRTSIRRLVMIDGGESRGGDQRFESIHNKPSRNGDEAQVSGDQAGALI